MASFTFYANADDAGSLWRDATFAATRDNTKSTGALLVTSTDTSLYSYLYQNSPTEYEDAWSVLHFDILAATGVPTAVSFRAVRSTGTNIQSTNVEVGEFAWTAPLTVSTRIIGTNLPAPSVAGNWGTVAVLAGTNGTAYTWNHPSPASLTLSATYGLAIWDKVKRAGPAPSNQNAWSGFYSADQAGSTQDPSLTITTATAYTKTITATASVTPSMKRGTAHGLAVAALASATLKRATARTVSATAGAAVAIVRQISHFVSIAAPLAASLSKGRVYSLAISAQAAASPAISRSSTRSIMTTAGAAAAIVKSIALRIGVAAAGTAEVARLISKRIDAGASTQASSRRAIFKTIAADAVTAAGLKRAQTVRIATTASAVATVTKSVPVRFAVAVAAVARLVTARFITPPGRRMKLAIQGSRVVRLIGNLGVFGRTLNIRGD